MEIGSLRLEPSWESVSKDQSVDILVETVFWDPKGLKHLVRTAIHRKFLRVIGVLPQSMAYSLMNFRVDSTCNGVTVSKGEAGIVFPHVVATTDDLFAVTEVCSGIGVMSDGLLSCGATICAKNALRETLIDFQMKQGTKGLIPGDIGQLPVLANFYFQHPHSSMIAAGFSCQPWSKLGDKQGFQDHRASSLHHTLRAAFFCRAHALLLECVTEAGSDQAVVDLIRAWCKCTGFQMQSKELRLETIWPSKRNRWWCLIFSPAVHPFEIRALPCQIKLPTVNDLFPIFPAWPQDEEEQLSLDLYETNKFIEFQSLDRAVIKGDNALPTALHGWGNQLQGCPCGCRKSSMDHSRLAKKGIFGALVVMEGHLESCQGQLTRTRHLHPWELSVLTGALPNKQWKPNLRLGICGLGQMASPIQSAWMYGQYQFEVGKQFGLLNLKSPEELLWDHVKQVFDAYHEKFPVLFQEPSVEAFVSSTFDLLWAAHMDTIVPSTIPAQSPALSMETSCAILNPTLQRADTHPEKSLTSETLQECIEPIIKDDGYADPDWECPYNDCVICDPEIVVQAPSFDQEKQILDTKTLQDISPTVAFSIEEHTTISNPFNDAGGVVAFSNKRMMVDPNACSSKKLKLSAIADEKPIPPEDHDKQRPEVEEGFSQKVRHTIRDQERLVATGIDAKQIPHQPTNGTVAVSHHVQLFYPWATTPSFVKVKKDVTIGCIEVAESKFGNVHQPVRTNNIVGVKLPIASITAPFQQLVFHYAPDFKHGPVESGPNWPLDTAQTHTRAELLFRQEGWVAHDEMDFYLSIIEKAGIGKAAQVYTLDPEISSPCQWINQLMSMSEEEHPSFSALLTRHHWIPVVVNRSSQHIRIASTNQGIDILQQHMDQDVEFVEIYTPQKFHADCGFQTIGAIIRATTDHASALSDTQKVFPVDSATAVTWRRMFEHHLFVSGKADTQLMTHQLLLGGAHTETPEAKLRELLLEHGVPNEAADDRVSQAFAYLGRPKILQAIRSHRPWQELKTVSNSITPRFQLVLPSELQSVIQKRASQPKPFGDKRHKQTKHDKRAPVVIRPEDVSVPDGIFKQGQSELVKQIPVQAIGTDACGVVVISATDALPYIRLSRPISKKGLGLLILDHSHEGCQGLGNVLRFPCRCEKNGEPVIATARLIQIGCTEITRNYPEHVPSVYEIPTVVVRAVLYRDEVADNWNDITDRPVKHIIQMLELPPDEDAQKSILDVWDRQYLTIKMGKSKPKDSDMFIVSLRLSSRAHSDVMQKSGSRGLYIEPRTQDGR